MPGPNHNVRWTANSEAPAVLPSSLDGISGTNAGEEENGGEDEIDNLAEIHGQFSDFIREAMTRLVFIGTCSVTTTLVSAFTKSEIKVTGRCLYRIKVAPATCIG